MKTVLITGGSGLVGKHLTHKLVASGYLVSILSRSGRSIQGVRVYTWDPAKKRIDQRALETADYIIHLAGTNIGEKRWNSFRKQNIIDSRVKSAGLIYDQLKFAGLCPEAFISASAIGYYGAITSDHIFNEDNLPANDFLGITCRLWEEAAGQFTDRGIRVVRIRTAPVLAENGGMLERMLLPVKMGIGSAIGNGKQFLPWIHIDDLCGVYMKAIQDNSMEGAYNAVAPEHVNNKEFTMKLAEAVKKPFWFPKVPALIMKTIFGEMAEMFLKGSRISSEKIVQAGYKFKFPQLSPALEYLASKMNVG